MRPRIGGSRHDAELVVVLVDVGRIQHRQLRRRRRMVKGVTECDHRADSVTRNIDALVAEVNGQGVNVSRHRLLVVSGLGLTGTAHSAYIDGDHAEALREGGHDLPVFPPRFRPTGQEHQGLAPPTGHVVQSDPVDVGVLAREVPVQGGRELLVTERCVRRHVSSSPSARIRRGPAAASSRERPVWIDLAAGSARVSRS